MQIQIQHTYIYEHTYKLKYKHKCKYNTHTHTNTHTNIHLAQKPWMLTRSILKVEEFSACTKNEYDWDERRAGTNPEMQSTSSAQLGKPEANYKLFSSWGSCAPPDPLNKSAWPP